jgi:hypothetical protein
MAMLLLLVLVCLLGNHLEVLARAGADAAVRPATSFDVRKFHKFSRLFQ